MMLLLKLKMSVRDRHFFRSGALFPSVKEAPWYVMYREGCYSNFNFFDSKQFRVLFVQIQNILQKFKSGPSKKGRPPRVKDHHCVLSLLPHSYCSPAEKKTWSENSAFNAESYADQGRKSTAFGVEIG
jgi:hypothetical protein